MIDEAEQLIKAAGAPSGEKAAELHKKGIDLLSCSIKNLGKTWQVKSCY